MVMQICQHVIDCPICGRPMEIQTKYVGRKLACGHCRGNFFVYDADDGELTATSIGGLDTLKRADDLLRRTCKTMSRQATNRPDQWFESLVELAEDDRCRNDPVSSPEADEREFLEQPIALLVEHRDEVFARIATDIAETGVRVVRARTATEALKLCSTYAPVLVVANLELPDQSGWLLAGKLQFVDCRMRVWLYKPQATEHEGGLAKFLQVDELLNYGGDLLGLSETIIDLMTDLHRNGSGNNDARELAAV